MHACLLTRDCLLAASWGLGLVEPSVQHKEQNQPCAASEETPPETPISHKVYTRIPVVNWCWLVLYWLPNFADVDTESGCTLDVS